MNRTVVFSAVAGIIALGIAGLVFLHVVSPDSTGAFVVQITTLVGLATTFAITSYALGKQSEKIDQVQKQTNGNLSRRDEEIAKLREELEAEKAKSR